MYVLLSGYLPFAGSNAMEVFEKVKEGNYSFKQKEWKRVSPEGIDLIKHMLEADTKKRYTAEQCLKHEWFKVAKEMVNDEKDALDPEILSNLANFKGSSSLKKAAMNLLVKTLNPKELDSLSEQFAAIDKDKTGTINAEELTKALKESKLSFTDKQIKGMIKEIDYAGNGIINYTEFIAATLKTRNFLNENRLYMLFKEFDKDNSDFITKDNLIEAFEKLDKPISKKEIEKIIEAHDTSKDGKISYDEFKAMMIGENQDLIEY